MQDLFNDDANVSHYAEDKPFRMSDQGDPDRSDLHDIEDTLRILSPSAMPIHFPRNRFFGGICLALPLSALIWFLVYFVWQQIIA